MLDKTLLIFTIKSQDLFLLLLILLLLVLLSIAIYLLTICTELITSNWRNYIRIMFIFWNY